jgi:glycosyltransferase involved in cell wall biosynthesis
MAGAARRLLAISWDMPPQSGPRAVQVSRTLREIAKYGWHTDVICFGARSTRYYPDPELAARLNLPPEVTRVPVPSLEERLPVRILWRVCPPLKRLPDEKRVWIGAATRAGLSTSTSRPPNAIVSFAQPWSDHLIGLRLHRATGVPWVAHFSDPWVEAPRRYSPLPQWQRRLWRRWEEEVIRDASAVVFVNRQTAEATMTKYPAGWMRKVHVVPHGFDAAVVPSNVHRPPDRRLHLVYTGRFYDDTRTPEPLFRALAHLATTRAIAAEVRVTLVGTIVPQHEQLARSLGLAEVVTFAGRLPFSDSARHAATADVLVVIDAASDNSLFLPSKLIEYLPFGKPILGITPPSGAAADVIRSLGYPVVAPDDQAGMAALVTRLVDEHAAGTLGPSDRHALVAASYDIRETARAFAAILDACAA